MNLDAFVVKMDTNLVLQQNFGSDFQRDIDGDSNNDYGFLGSNTAGGNDEDSSTSIFVDSTGVYIGRRSWNGNNFDGFLIKLGNSGNQQHSVTFSDIAGGNETDEIKAVVANSSSVFLGGSSKSTSKYKSFIIEVNKSNLANNNLTIIDDTLSIPNMGDSSIESLYADVNDLFAVGKYKNTSTNYDDMYVAKLDLSSNSWTHNH